jgi:hypothetical protein
MGDFNASHYSDKFIADLVAFVAADGFQTKFERFFVTNALHFDNDEEHKLIYYEVYQEFSSMFETELESFMRAQDMTQAEFVRRCRNAGNEDAKVKQYIDILLSSCEYETFVKLMKIMKPVAELRKLNAQRAADAKNSDDSGSASLSKGSDSPSKAQPYGSASAKGDADDSNIAGAKTIEMDDLSDAKASSSGQQAPSDAKGNDSK